MKACNLITFALSLLSAASAVSAAKTMTKCCGECPEGQKKYYSVDRLFNRCGECCMKPEDFWKFKIFEPGMYQANSENPCFDLGYSQYENTETHGAFKLKMTLDKYRKPRNKPSEHKKEEIKTEDKPVENNDTDEKVELYEA